ncbi:MAG: hypothetical protein JNM76_13245 [Betaproteobacteria bacterium]|nr:hypothetical protein [Betaproteobacteria bacterium]
MTHSLDTLGRTLQAGDPFATIEALVSDSALGETQAGRLLLARAYLRVGSADLAEKALGPLNSADTLDEETWGVRARVRKQRWLDTRSTDALIAARDAYLAGYRATQSLWCADNAAQLSLELGETDTARTLGMEMFARIDAQRAARQEGNDADAGSNADPFWAAATEGDACLMAGRTEQASACYALAARLGAGRHGDLHAARQGIRLIAKRMGHQVDDLLALFPTQVVAAFTGHAIDKAGKEKRFSADLEGWVAENLAKVVQTLKVDVGIAAAACGGDILFLEAMHKAGKETHMVLPHPPEEFIKTSVLGYNGKIWEPRFWECVKRAKSLTILSPDVSGDLTYQYQGQVIGGLARVRAEANGGRPIGLSLWNQKPGLPGGAGWVTAEWLKQGMEVHRIHLDYKGHNQEAVADLVPELQTISFRELKGHHIVALLFADAKGFSTLNESQVGTFVQTYMKMLSDLSAVHSASILDKNTWGDGLYMVFRDLAAAARFALALQMAMAEMDCEKLNLPKGLAVRTALHAGPVWEFQDPFLGGRRFFGTHISRAARIEPAIVPGVVYVSEEFAALLALDDPAPARKLSFVGNMPLAKDYGKHRLYRLAAR